MSLTGGSSLHSLLHDIITSIVHQTDKAIFEARQAGEWEWVPADQSFAFPNDFGPLKKLDVHRLYATDVPEIDGPAVPEPWDKPGNLASFSVGSHASAARSYDGGRHVTGAKRKKGEIPDLPPADLKREFVDLEGGKVVTSMEFLRAMLRLRVECMDYHRYSKGYWKPTPAYTSVKSRKGDPVDTGAADILDFAGGQLVSILELAEKGDLQAAVARASELRLSVEEHREESSKRPVVTKPDLRRLTVNFHPAHCRAMHRALKDGVAPEVLQRISDRVSPRLGAKIEEVTGRKVAAESDHWDSKLFHKNFWHHGCERVRYVDAKGTEKIRIRRTAVNLNSSGGFLAHDRLRRTFSRMGKDFGDYAPKKVDQLKDAERRALERQGCLPGDWEINAFADELMEEALRGEGLDKYIESGFEEFLDHEILRHQSGFGEKMSAKEMAERKTALAMEIGQLEDAEQAKRILGANEGEGIVAAARRVTEQANRPAVEKIVERKIIEVVVPPELLREHAEALDNQKQSLIALEQKRDALNAELDTERKRVVEAEDRIKELANEAEKARDDRHTLRETLRPRDGETLPEAARRMVQSVDTMSKDYGSTVAKTEALESELTASQKKVGDLEKEIGFLRQVAEVAGKFLRALMKSGPKLSPELMQMLNEIATLLKVNFTLTKKSEDKEQGMK